MRQFFRGWKRKVGCVTLALACLFAAAWVRSLSVPTGVSWGRGNLDYDMVSHAGRVMWECKRWQMTTLPPDAPVGVVQSVKWYTPGKRELAQHPMSIFKKENRRDYIGVSFGTYIPNTASKPPSTTPLPDVVWYKRCVMQYWLPTIPLTLLSAWLLLSKPREKKVVE